MKRGNRRIGRHNRLNGDNPVHDSDLSASCQRSWERRGSDRDEDDKDLGSAAAGGECILSGLKHDAGGAQGSPLDLQPIEVAILSP